VSSLLMADLCLRRGSPRDAEGACLEALAIFKRRADRPGEADAYRILGSVRALEDSWEEAEACFARSLEINQACGQRLQWAETERDLGHLEVRRGRLDAARGHLETARAAFEDVGARGAARQLEDDIRRLDPAEQPASGR
jgi:tetratricopeptide (TPR) repeat protein